ncbi:PREDICTED: vegetative cell wall protein gp1-like [Myotis brandtii]|uniref:vegetative cell wall protein gp1-like n=1 Tax=Myotis brandtii TaxID=109478 RepID=UPI00070464F4|nr:PREDICTED: vegetative cell wall protein gp1-like [Myotis brandtii]
MNLALTQSMMPPRQLEGRRGRWPSPRRASALFRFPGGGGSQARSHRGSDSTDAVPWRPRTPQPGPAAFRHRPAHQGPVSLASASVDLDSWALGNCTCPARGPPFPISDHGGEQSPAQPCPCVPPTDIPPSSWSLGPTSAAPSSPPGAAGQRGAQCQGFITANEGSALQMPVQDTGEDPDRLQPHQDLGPSAPSSPSLEGEPGPHPRKRFGSGTPGADNTVMHFSAAFPRLQSRLLPQA